MFVIPDFPNVPALDIDSVLQQGGGGGGGGQSPFEQNQEDDNRVRETDEEAAQRIIDLITDDIEPDQWQDNGGDGASVRFYKGTLLIRAPDYIHRQIVEPPFMRSTAVRAGAGSMSSADGARRPITNRTPPADAPAEADAPKDAAPDAPTPAKQP
jgi:hypothetical protein